MRQRRQKGTCLPFSCCTWAAKIQRKNDIWRQKGTCLQSSGSSYVRYYCTCL